MWPSQKTKTAEVASSSCIWTYRKFYLVVLAVTEVVKPAIFQSLQSKYRHLLSRPSVFTTIRPCLGFQFQKHAYFHLEPNAPVVINQVGLRSRSIQTWERIHSLRTPGTHQWQESFLSGCCLQRATSRLWSWIANANLLSCWLCNIRNTLKHLWEYLARQRLGN